MEFWVAIKRLSEGKMVKMSGWEGDKHLTNTSFRDWYLNDPESLHCFEQKWESYPPKRRRYSIKKVTKWTQ